MKRKPVVTRYVYEDDGSERWLAPLVVRVSFDDVRRELVKREQVPGG